LTSSFASPPALSALPRMLVRPFRPGDEDACAGIFNRAWSAALPDLPRRMDGREFLNQTRGEEILVAEADGRLLGFASVYRPDAFIHHLFVEPAFHRRGVGGALLDRALALAGGSATLKCLRRNEGAWAFYARAGWREVEQGADEWGEWGRLAMRTGAADG
jgi:GNAT superfamily N-acetyltransferase